jgi:hypothetical protein
MIRQQTGEKWENVNLNLSTAQPLVVRKVPVLKPISYNESDEGYGEVQGLVLLEDGSSIPGVTVTLARDDGTWLRRVVTDEKGAFFYKAVPNGVYNMKCELEGFRTVIQKGLRVFDHKISKATIQMETGAIHQEVVVTSQLPTIDVRKSESSQTFDRSSFSSIGRSRGGSYSPAKRRQGKALKGKAQFSVENQVKLMERKSSQVSNRGISANFAIKHRETITSDTQYQKVSIVLQGVKTKIERVVIPKHSEYAYVKAKVINSPFAPLLAGKMHIFFNGAFVNTSDVEYVNPQESFQVPVGLDESIRVQRNVIPMDAETKGLFKKKRIRRFGYIIKIKNFKDERISLRVMDQVPVSKKKEIKVITTLVEPEPLKKRALIEKGFLEWEMAIKPAEEKVIKVLYMITYPKDYFIDESF